jgi:hypothetical protein
MEWWNIIFGEPNANFAVMTRNLDEHQKIICFSYPIFHLSIIPIVLGRNTAITEAGSSGAGSFLF